ncbi:SITS-binding protein, partial [Egretta garzetta]
QFCYAWEEDAELRLSLEPPPAPATECYSVCWTPLRPDVVLKDCFSMANISWYGGVSIRAQRWPLNGAESRAQPFVTGDFGKNPAGYGPVLERYFLGSTGVTVTVAPDVPLFLSLESNRHFCLETRPFRGVGAVSLPSPPMGCSVWSPAGGDAKPPALQRHCRSSQTPPSVSPSPQDHVPSERRKRHAAAPAWDPSLIKPLRLSITLSSPPGPSGSSSPISPSKSHFLKLPVFSKSPKFPFLGLFSRHTCLPSTLGFFWGVPPCRGTWQGCRAWGSSSPPGPSGSSSPISPSKSHFLKLAGDRYTGVLAAALATLGNATVISAGARWVPALCCGRWLRELLSHAGLKGVIPSVLHYSLLGYNFFIPDAVGGSLAGDTPGDPELYVRWLQIVTFLPVMAFGTPPWLCCDAWVLNLTRQCIQRHRDFVVPLLIKYSEEWLSLGYPIFRPVWWLSPTDPTAFTIEDEFLIGDEVLVAPVTEKGQMWRDIYLPGEGHLWMDTNTAHVFDGGTILRNYSAGLAEVPVFIK